MRVEQYWSHSFIPALIRKNGVVLDIGMHRAGFAKVVAPLCGKVICFEPDPRWRGVSDLPANVQVVEKAVAGSAGILSFHVNTEKCSSLHYSDGNGQTIDVKSITLAEALELVPDDRIDLIKMDIEGEEIAVLENASDQLNLRIVQMTVEFHDFLDPAALPKIKSIVTRMGGLGFYAFRFSRRNYGDMLFINSHFVKINAFQKWWIILRFKYIRGILRVLKRWLGQKTL